MKKTIVILLVVCLFLMVGCQNNEDNGGIKEDVITNVPEEMFGVNTSTMNLKGPVKSVESRSYSGFSGDAVTDFFYDMGFMNRGHKTVLFNEKGFATEEVEYNKNGDMMSRLIYTYDKNDMVVGERSEMAELNNNLILKYVTDDSGNVLITENKQIVEIQIVTDGKKEIAGSYENTYDHQNRIIEKILKLTGSSDQGYESYVYNERGYISEVRKYMMNGPESVITFVYGEDGFMTYVNIVNGGDETEYKYTHVLDDQGNWIEQNIYKFDELKFKVERTVEYY